MSSYKHTQVGYVINVGMLLAILLTASLGLAHHAPIPTLPLAGVLVVVTVLSWNLTIEIADGRLLWRFGPGLIRKSVALSDIAHVEPVPRRGPFCWGIHRTRDGWLYNVSGWQTVQVQLKNGQRFRLGTDEPQKLVEAIQAATSLVP
jgi:hypothetical protein